MIFKFRKYIYIYVYLYKTISRACWYFSEFSELFVFCISKISLKTVIFCLELGRSVKTSFFIIHIAKAVSILTKLTIFMLKSCFFVENVV